LDKQWWTLIAAATAVFMLLLDVTIVNVALPDIQSQLHGSLSDLRWVIDAYALTSAALLLTARRATRRAWTARRRHGQLVRGRPERHPPDRRGDRVHRRPLALTLIRQKDFVDAPTDSPEPLRKRRAIHSAPAIEG
jgi:MFS family permease